MQVPHTQPLGQDRRSSRHEFAYSSEPSGIMLLGAVSTHQLERIAAWPGPVNALALRPVGSCTESSQVQRENSFEDRSPSKLGSRRKRLSGLVPIVMWMQVANEQGMTAAQLRAHANIEHGM